MNSSSFLHHACSSSSSSGLLSAERRASDETKRRAFFQVGIDAFTAGELRPNATREERERDEAEEQHLIRI